MICWGKAFNDDKRSFKLTAKLYGQVYSMRAMILGELCVQNVFARSQELCAVNSVPVQPKLHRLT